MRDLKQIFTTYGYNEEETEQNEMVLDLMDDLCKKEIEPHALEMDATGCTFDVQTGKVSYPSQTYKILKKMAQNDLMGLAIPEEYEGAGLSFTLNNACYERISRADAGTSLLFGLQNSTSDVVEQFGTPEAKEHYLPKLARGEKIGGLLFTEPGSGSDLGSLKTKVTDDGSQYIVNGVKNFISNAGIADSFLFLGSTDPEKGSRGLTAFILDTENNPGFKITRIEEKLGLHSNATAEVMLEDVIIPKENVLGEIGRGFSIVLYELSAARIGIGAQAVGIADAAYRKAATYVKTRKQFGKPIESFQATQWKLADMFTKIHTARVAYLTAARMKDLGQDFAEYASIGKLYGSEIAQQVTYEAIQMHGGYGYVKDYDVERYYRDVRITPIYEGTNEVQRIVISRAEMKKNYAAD
ncbi:MAG: acyl-CoA dehydrogenase family protein [Candidatus Heimdallarchaeota archaeon]|nr:MAG: acyl-CoA dehydrogenase family protein [Candidatus Heimdallarchaeota archaeon]